RSAEIVGAGFIREEALQGAKSFAGKHRSHSLESYANVRRSAEIVGAGFIREETLKRAKKFRGQAPLPQS
ncbi:hypothetical protein, partial [Pseudomonas sp. MWU13-2100]|uniref:hypothetical protein n=1 Tax=Pseudomonas sp. MWU13-2100 TaxID=2935075 RepID=UPI00200D727D